MRNTPICGGTTRNVDSSAPKTINSRKMTFFTAESSFETLAVDRSTLGEYGGLDFISGYAARLRGGSFLTLDARFSGGERGLEWAYISGDVFPTLDALAREYELAKNNGYHSFTHGLPMNFGGSLSARYESGEEISFSDNQTPIFQIELAIKLFKLFKDAMKGERAAFPEVGELCAVRFYEELGDGYTRFELEKRGEELNLKKVYKFDDPRVSEYNEKASPEKLDRISAIVRDSAIILWDDFPKRSFGMVIKKSLTFAFSDGSEITIQDDRLLPAPLSGAFYKIETELHNG